MIAAGLSILLLLTVLSPAVAGDRVDLYDAKGRRIGYAVVDPTTGRVDYYDVNARRTGWGRLSPSGRAERFDLSGRRQPATVLPAPLPQRERGR